MFWACESEDKKLTGKMIKDAINLFFTKRDFIVFKENQLAIQAIEFLVCLFLSTRVPILISQIKQKYKSYLSSQKKSLKDTFMKYLVPSISLASAKLLLKDRDLLIRYVSKAIHLKCKNSFFLDILRKLPTSTLDSLFLNLLCRSHLLPKS